ncbi:MAG: restriction endonuclease [Candidatus Gastranaerophilales bacterium]|nr:restriction endonuclease [Candidatus Gastranaerophilales bacterium]
MTVPNYQDFMLPTLKLIADNCEHKSRDIIEQAANMLGLSEEDKQEKLPSQTQSTYYNRAMWARTYLKKACLLDYPERGVIKITQRGLDLLKTNPKKITKNFLLQYDEFREFQNTVNIEQNETDNSENTEKEKTPDELIAEARTILTSHLEADLLSKISENSPTFFEELVAKLLLSMGYGGSEKDILQNRGKSGDEGIDGIIKQDVLGLDKIYIQAKRWSGNVSRPEVQKFVGAVHGQNANRGVFITTSSFSNEAREYAKNINSNIILVDGKQLAKLMIEYNVGVQIKDTFQIKKIDEDFFAEE